MDRYVVHLRKTVESHVSAVAGSPTAAVEVARKSPDFPGMLRPDAFGDASFVDAGEWEVDRVTDVFGNVVLRAEDEPSGTAT